jgi:hypothetical protein
LICFRAAVVDGVAGNRSKGFAGQMQVRLVRKLADRVNGVDLTRFAIGDTIDLPERDARMLIAEGWAVPGVPDPPPPKSPPPKTPKRSR